MPAIDIPFFGTLVLCLILISAGYTVGVAALAGRGRPRLIPSARFGTYATCALVLLAVLLLAYAFQTHDFRIRYVSRYSDRSMSTTYLLTSLWGGQDGSLLWWTFLLGGYTAGAVRWMKGRYRELQPYVIATLMVVVAFFAILIPSVGLRWITPSTTAHSIACRNRRCMCLTVPGLSPSFQ